MRWLRLLFRIFGWLLTPFLAWAASFFGAVGGALIAMRIGDPVDGLAVTALCGAIAGFAVLILWLAPGVRARLASLGTRWPLAVRIGAVTLGLLVLVVLGLRLVPMLLAVAVVAVGLVSTRPAATSLTEPTGPSADG